METYNYLQAVKDDVLQYIEDNGININVDNFEEIEEYLNEKLFVNDNVTGNASGSYTFSTWRAEEYLCHNMELLSEALAEFCCSDINVLEKGAEYCDVTIRCYLLNQAINEVISEILN